MKRRMLSLVIVLGLVASLALTGCNEAKPGATNAPTVGTIKIAYQNGLSYSPFYVMQEMKIIEKYLPNVKVEWTVLASGSAVSEGLAAGSLDIGVMGVAPLLTAWDKGFSMKIFSGLVNSPLGLVVLDDKYMSLKNFTEPNKDKIAVPAPKSIQHILLSMAAQKQLGKATALDEYLKALAHPDAQTALLNKIDIVAHFSSPPFLFSEVAKGGKVAVDGFDAFGGDFSFLVSVASKKFMDEQPAYAGAVYMAMSETIGLINSKDDAAVQVIMSKEKLTKDTAIKYLDWAGTNFTTTPYGLAGLAKYMKDVGYIEKLPASYSDYCWSTATATIGQRAGGPSVLEKAQNRK
ncbi:MAG: ABC transporter substrate-binding protein [Clostridia bacterium]|jgi:NitT/TauT family transport system substrate-binding protein